MAKYRQGSAAVVLNQKDELLLVNLRSFEKQFFAIPGGGLEAGESFLECIYRELDEELGLGKGAAGKNSLEFAGKVEEPLRFHFKSGPMIRDGEEYIGQERYYFGFHFLGTDVDIRPHEAEVRKYVWSGIAELDNYLLFDNQLEDTLKMTYELFPHLRSLYA